MILSPVVVGGGLPAFSGMDDVAGNWCIEFYKSGTSEHKTLAGSLESGFGQSAESQAFNFFPGIPSLVY